MRIGLLLCLIPLAAVPLIAQQPAEIVGSWSGVSLCMDKATDRACKDEVVLYHVRPDTSSSVRVFFDAWKIVARDTVSMGEITLDAASEPHSWVKEFGRARGHVRWTFTVSGRTLTGTLVELPSQRLIRRVTTERITP